MGNSECTQGNFKEDPKTETHVNQADIVDESASPRQDPLGSTTDNQADLPKTNDNLSVTPTKPINSDKKQGTPLSAAKQQDTQRILELERILVEKDNELNFLRQENHDLKMHIENLNFSFEASWEQFRHQNSAMEQEIIKKQEDEQKLTDAVLKLKAKLEDSKIKRKTEFQMRTDLMAQIQTLKDWEKQLTSQYSQRIAELEAKLGKNSEAPVEQLTQSKEVEISEKKVQEQPLKTSEVIETITRAQELASMQAQPQAESKIEPQAQPQAQPQATMENVMGNPMGTSMENTMGNTMGMGQRSFEDKLREVKIIFVDHDGAVVPVITPLASDYKGEFIEELFAELSMNSAEVLREPGSALKIYTKEKTQAEMEAEGSTQFHKGYSIRTFFEKFKKLVLAIDRESYESVKPFLDEKEHIDDLLG